jgi:hypothetical protein
MFSNFFFIKACLLLDSVEKYCIAGQATDDNMAQAHCVLDTQGCKYTHIHTHTHTGCVRLISFPLQQWFHERVSML